MRHLAGAVAPGFGMHVPPVGDQLAAGPPDVSDAAVQIIKLQWIHAVVVVAEWHVPVDLVGWRRFRLDGTISSTRTCASVQMEIWTPGPPAPASRHEGEGNCI